MAIGTAMAIGLAATAAGSALSSRSASKAASKASDTSAAVAQQNNALARDIYGQNKSALSPYMQRGNAAGDQMNALLGLGAAPQQQQPQQQSAFAPQAVNEAYPNNRLGQYMNQYLRQQGQMYQPAEQMAQPVVAPQQNAQGAANNAFDIFRNSTGYQFRLGEGMNALNSGYAGAGLVQSGDAMRAANEYGQNFASNEFGNYMGYLGNQQGVGLSGASALAGVGQNYANSVTANNNSAGAAAANAALVKGQNNPFASVLGTVGGGLIGGF